MATRQEKERFIKTLQREIKDREKIVSFFHSRYLPTVHDFDGHTFDFYRLREALQRQMTDPLMYVWNDNIHNPSNPRLQIRKKVSQYNNCGEQRLNVPLALTNGKIDYEKTAVQLYGVVHYSEETAKLYSIISNYDALLDVYNELVAVAEKFSKLPRRFRENLQRVYIPQVD